ncbi:MAG: class I mannose-6-phosphate isomerase [Verrucomicrobia bacterium]|nr:class I mannose-6-phosphate isomerase [Verrucomicrobiota bacterium]
METLYPLRFTPVYKDYIWGGNRIPTLYGRKLPAGIYAESWEISTHPDGITAIANGPLAGKTLRDLLPEHQSALLGPNVRGGDFPLLIKLIDARETLSVQVHPNNGNAAAVQGDPKTEMWYFLEGDGSAQIYCGLKPGIGRAEFLKAMENKTFAEVLQTVPAEKGNAVFVPGGRIHAIGAGCLILEIQQNSNTTYRIYDWDRVDANGKGRELHIDKALKVIDWDNNGDPRCKISGTQIQTSPFFQLDRFELTSARKFPMSGKSFQALFIAEGSGVIGWNGGEEKMAAGQSWLVPAALGGYTVSPVSSGITLLCITVP